MNRHREPLPYDSIVDLIRPGTLQPVNKPLPPYPPQEDTVVPMTKRASERVLHIDPDRAADSIAAMADDLRAMEWELACAVRLANKLGMSWGRLGEQLGLTRQGAQQWAKRAMAKGTDYELWSSAERQAAARALGARERAVRWQLRRIVSGRPGVSRVTRETISTHYSRAVAERKGETIEGAELWRLDPNGAASEVRNWRAAHRARLRRSHQSESF